MANENAYDMTLLTKELNENVVPKDVKGADEHNKATVESLQEKVEPLRIDNETLKKENETLKKENERLKKENETLNDNETLNKAKEIMRASLQGYESSAEDTVLLNNLRSFDVRKQSDSQPKNLYPILADLVDIFTELYKKDIFTKVKSRVALSTWETSKVNCLTLSVSLMSKLTIKYGHQPLTSHLMLYLEDLIEAALPNKVAARMSQIFLTSLCNISEIHGVDIGEERRSTLCRCFSRYSSNDLIKIPSAYLLVVAFNSKGPKVHDDGIREFIDYLNAVVARSNSDTINGFFMGPTQRDQISRASMKISNSKTANNFVSEPIGNKPTSALPGVGPKTEAKLAEVGMTKSTHVLGEYLKCDRDKTTFQNRRNDITKNNKVHSGKTYGGLDQWAKNNLF